MSNTPPLAPGTSAGHAPSAASANGLAYVAWVLRRELCGHVLNGELTAVSPAFRAIVEHLDSLPLADRPTALDGWICSRDDAGAIIEAMAGVDPSGPAPEAGVATGPAPFSLDLVGSADFFAQEFPIDWRIKGVLVANEPAGLGGPSKTLKTSILVDQTISMGTSTPFLGRFEVPRPFRVALISGESGRRVIQSTARQVCLSRGLTARDLGNIHWGFTLPQLTNSQHLTVLRKTIEDLGLEWIGLDPFYLSLMAGNAGVDPKNMFEMGPILADVARACIEAGCTVSIAHHFTKKRDDPFGPPELGEFAYGGFGQFIRQWIMVAPRERFDAELGLFKLHFNYGGSAGHCGEFAVDIEVGKLEPDLDRRCWKVTIQSPSEERVVKDERRRAEVAAKAEEKDRVRVAEEERKGAALAVDAADALKGEPGRKATRRRLRDLLSCNDDVVGRMIVRMEKAGMIRPADVMVPTRGGGSRPAAGFELVDGWEQNP